MINHILELRRRLLHTLIFFIGFLLIFFFWANHLFEALIAPLLHALPTPNTLIATQITAPVFTPLKLAADAACLLSAPIALFHCWRFASPGLYKEEQYRLRGALILSLLLFLVGLLFCFYLVLPLMFHFFTQALPQGVLFMPDMNSAADFIVHMLLLFGFSFQVPLVCLVLVRLHITNIDTLRSMRPYTIVAAFSLGMLLTPPDVLSQILLAVPLCLLYETGIILATIFSKR